MLGLTDRRGEREGQKKKRVEAIKLWVGDFEGYKGPLGGVIGVQSCSGRTLGGGGKKKTL